MSRVAPARAARDTEGGQATLFIGPTGESLLVDTGNAGERDLGRILDTRLSGSAGASLKVQPTVAAVAMSLSATVTDIFCRYLELGSVRKLKAALEQSELHEEAVDAKSQSRRPRTRGALYHLLSNPVYIGQVRHKCEVYDGQHAPLLDQELWENVQAQL